MSIAFTPGSSLYDVTVIENIFIDTLLCDMPGDYVKVYVYSLRRAYEGSAPDSLEAAARALNMDPSLLLSAYSYLQSKNVLRLRATEPLDVELYNIKHTYYDGLPRPDAPLEIEEEVTKLLGASRALTQAEKAALKKWHNEYGMDEAALLVYIRRLLSVRGTRGSLIRLDGDMKERSRDGCRTLMDMNRYLKRLEAQDSGAVGILDAFNVNRTPTDEEVALYEKWAGEWELDVGALRAAAASLTWTSSPSFKLLDGVAAKLHAAGAHTAQDAARFFEQGETKHGFVSDIASLLGEAPVKAFERELNSCLEAGFSFASLRSGTLYCARFSHRKVASLVKLLQRISEEAGTGDADVSAWLNAHSAYADEAQRWLSIWGVSRAPTENEAEVCRRVREEWHCPEEIVTLAVEDARGASSPMRYTLAILKSCASQNITRAEEYRARRADIAAYSPPDPNNFEFARKYDDKDFAEDYTNIFSEDALT